ncbi:sodium-coupled monocarboxylate transporter 1-like [Mercenaria mercenaria]|uniref:sodium-coupled monocarboxylate transporter 1-like n=1 Tax=Mercenaria mercenaria TaxID=6596 RepID=UPI00234F4A83|nr:sodium-coupled monocarboxylate transporter 1-like [Mercenaria mercenaria]
MAALEGATIFASKRCDILGAEVVSNINEILPFTVLEIFQNQPGLSGLFIASLSSAALSTLSSCMSSLSAITYEDIIKIKFPGMHPYKAIRIAKFLVLLYGLVAMGLAFAISQIPGSVSAIFASFMGCMDGPVCAIFVLSAMFRRATTKGVFLGAVCGMVASFWINMGSLFSGLPSYPYLLSGPTDQCYMYEGKQSKNISILHMHAMENVTNTRLSIVNVSTTMSAADDTSSDSMSPLAKIYSTSYIMFSFIGFMTSLIIGFLASLLTTPPKQFDERCLFSFRKHFVEELFKTKKVNALNQKEVDEVKKSVFLLMVLFLYIYGFRNYMTSR